MRPPKQPKTLFWSMIATSKFQFTQFFNFSSIWAGSNWSIPGAEQLVNPWGDDEDDFEVNFLIDRNLELSFVAVDNLFGVLPDNTGRVFVEVLEFS